MKVEKQFWVGKSSRYPRKRWPEGYTAHYVAQFDSRDKAAKFASEKRRKDKIKFGKPRYHFKVYEKDIPPYFPDSHPYAPINNNYGVPAAADEYTGFKDRNSLMSAQEKRKREKSIRNVNSAPNGIIKEHYGPATTTATTTATLTEIAKKADELIERFQPVVLSVTYNRPNNTVCIKFNYPLEINDLQSISKRLRLSENARIQIEFKDDTIKQRG